ncbi:MAG: hypothetical protein L6Q97_27265, partial [Thermoanaerobaculia bacterium]|nr:hypothetical protein [Thermoanaerobaculia bacterium]
IFHFNANSMNAHKKTRIAATMTGTNEAGTPDKDNAVPASSSILRPNCDIFTYRHLYQQLEADLLAVFKRKFSRFQRLQTDLGRPGIFDWPEAQAKKLHDDAAELKRELDIMVAMRDYLEGLTDFSIESWGRLSDRCMILEEENAILRAQLRSTEKSEMGLIAALGAALEIVDDLQTRITHLQNTAGHERSI